MAFKFMSINASAATGQIVAAKERLRLLSGEANAILARALQKYGEFILSKSIDRAPVSTRRGSGGGGLRASGTVSDAIDDGNSVKVQVGFNVPYAAIRDHGGIIRPVRAKSLFIPLRPGVRPSKSPSRKHVLGVDFILVPGPTTNKRFVRQKGNRYFSGTVQEFAPRAEELIGAAIEDELGKIGG